MTDEFMFWTWIGGYLFLLFLIGAAPKSYDKDDRWLLAGISILWPIIATFAVFAAVLFVPYRAGCVVRKLFWKETA